MCVYIYIYIYIYYTYILYLQNNGAARLFKWVSENQMKRNTDKCHLLLSKHKSSEIQIGECIIRSSDYGKLLGIKIDSKLYFL